MSELHILVADDHPLFLRGIVDFLHQLRYKNLLTATDGLSALQKIIDHQPDLAIIDLEMPYLTGLEVAQKTREKEINTKFILISYQQDPWIVQMADRLNVTAYILKEDSLSLLDKCIQAVIQGDMYFSKSFDSGHPNVPQAPGMEDLTPTEVKILRMIAEEKSSKAIASQYGVSIRTIEKHRSNLIHKLQLEGTPTSLYSWVQKYKQYL